MRRFFSITFDASQCHRAKHVLSKTARGIALRNGQMARGFDVRLVEQTCSIWLNRRSPEANGVARKRLDLRNGRVRGFWSFWLLVFFLPLLLALSAVQHSMQSLESAEVENALKVESASFQRSQVELLNDAWISQSLQFESKNSGMNAELLRQKMAVQWPAFLHEIETKNPCQCVRFFASVLPESEHARLLFSSKNELPENVLQKFRVWVLPLGEHVWSVQWKYTGNVFRNEQVWAFIDYNSVLAYAWIPVGFEKNEVVVQ